MVVALLRHKIPVIGDALRVKPGYVDGKLVLDVGSSRRPWRRLMTT